MSGSKRCSVCGVIFANSLGGQQNIPWYAQARALYRRGREKSTYLSGIGRPGYSQGLEAPLDSDYSYRDVQRPQRIELIHKTTTILSDAWGFGIHDACWKMLYSRNIHYAHAIDLAESVFNQILSAPHLEDVSTEGYFNLERFAKDSHVRKDPFDVPSLDELEAAAPPRLAAAGLIPIGASGNSRHFSKLSVELTFEILSYLPFSDLLRLRLVCRELAAIMSFDALPRSYWRDRFSAGQEGAFLGVDLSAQRDWYRLFRGTLSLLKTNKSLRNRKRIWQRLDSFEEVARCEASPGRTSHGYALERVVTNPQTYTYQVMDHRYDDGIPDCLQLKCFSSGHIPGHGYEDTVGASDPCHYKAVQLEFPTGGGDGEVEVSFIQVGDQEFISGMRFWHSGYPEGRVLKLGYYGHDKTRRLRIPYASHFNAVEFAFSVGGLVGLSFKLRNIGSTRWIDQGRGSNIARKVMRLPKVPKRCFLVAGLDRYKIVSLGLALPADEGGQQTPSNNMTVEPKIWFPYEPSWGVLQASALKPPNSFNTFTPRLHVDFGGPGGVLLNCLTRLSLHIHLSHRAFDPWQLAGISFHFLDGGVKTLGLSGGVEISMLIDGPGEERITAFEVSAYIQSRFYRYRRICGLKFSTNSGRAQAFGATTTTASECIRRYEHQPRKGTFITGLIAVRPPVGIQFASLGVLTQSLSGQVLPTSSPDSRMNHDLSPESAEGDNESSFMIKPVNAFAPRKWVQSYASLKGVRRIQASIGLPGRSRSLYGISGLRVDYNDHRSSEIVGQWMHEHEVFDLGENEKVVCLTVWRAIEPWPSPMRGEKGHVMAVLIGTDHDRSKLFCSPWVCPPFEQCLRFEIQVAPDEKFSSLAWMMDLTTDWLQPVKSTENPTQSSKPEMSDEESHQDVPDACVQFRPNVNGYGIDRVKEVSGFFEGDSIIALEFIYNAYPTHSVGNQNPSLQRNTMSIPPNSRIIGVSAKIHGVSLKDLEFHVESIGEGPDKPQREWIRFPSSRACRSYTRYMWSIREETTGQLEDLDTSSHVQSVEAESEFTWAKFCKGNVANLTLS
ncbi:hypothetical protein P170DRAFT_512974 [Aspergillus steynii IBT 23096]|uniref:F-box domain-containing protein n=1 Tax=Aspergillus steynii IBT 23096 TaxID=1392250 RepID=A0A2I2FW31_9EURO|nr:uncharacterized protein P170DRAFT_512974 [Aspergillus steynii IBT 23096]PLB44841.1 hypothetical protein P170DRAFT_512974 [Aspergillus steynii IBT 23096]